MGLNVPHDLDAERAVVGGAIVTRDALTEVLAGLDPGDLYDRSLANLWTVVGELHRTGSSVDHLTIRNAYEARGWDPTSIDLAELMTQGLRPRPEHVAIILRHATARRLIAATGAASGDAANGKDPYELAEQLRAELADLDMPMSTTRPSARTLDDIIDSADDDSPFVVPGLLRRDWRAIVVGAEGVGKSTLLRQIGVLAAQGVHPFDLHRCEPIRVLLADLENPVGAIKETGKRMVTQLRRTVGNQYDPDRLRIHMRPGGIDVRGRHDRSELEREIIAHRPDLVVIGPVYKLSHRRDRESYEDATEPVLRILDDLRTRHGFALLMEHHAPQGSQGVRDIRPFGSQRWMAWPELGIGLRPNQDRTGQILTRWRGDRLRNNWPDEVRRDSVWPWIGYWANPPGEAF